MTRRTTIIIGATCAILGGAATAGAQTSHILGSDGPHIKLDAMCRRAVVAPPGQTLKMDVNVIGQQVHCLIRRPDPFARCVRRLGVPPVVTEKSDHGPGKPGDEIGAARLAGYVASVYACSKAHL